MRTVTVAGAALALAIAAAISTQAQTPSVPPQRIAPEQLASQHEATLAGLADPLQRCATRALAGEFGPLRPWQARWYAQALATQPRPRRVWQTQYGEWDPGRYRGDRYHIAANPRHLQRGSVVWLSKPGILCVVTNRGADSNDRIAKAHGCDHWVDLHTAYEGQYGLGSATCDAYLLGVAGGW